MKTITLALCSLGLANAFISTVPVGHQVACRSTSAITPRMSFNAEDEVVRKVSRAARRVSPTDRTATLGKPLGLVLEQDEVGDVYIVKIKEGSNADRNKKIQVGDVISSISATFGDDVWSVRGAGLARVQKAVQVRKGDVTLVLETTEETKSKKKAALNLFQKKVETEEDEQLKRDRHAMQPM
ncbi:unnamed protein product [Chrysoparadoxa australica]